jgi:BlaI family transcriptional regulator, penicillinase repressor
VNFRTPEATFLPVPCRLIEKHLGVTIYIVPLSYDGNRILTMAKKSNQKKWGQTRPPKAEEAMPRAEPTMPARAEQVVPTKGELEVLKILWKNGPSSVRLVHDVLSAGVKNVRYTSTLKTMQVMTERGMLKRDETHMTHVYYPLLEEEKTMGSILERFVDSVYDGSISNLLITFVNNNKSSAEELKKVKELLKKLDKDK